MVLTFHCIVAIYYVTFGSLLKIMLFILKVKIGTNSEENLKTVTKFKLMVFKVQKLSNLSKYENVSSLKST